MSNFKPMHDKNDSNVISVVEKDYFNDDKIYSVEGSGLNGINVNEPINDLLSKINLNLYIRKNNTIDINKNKNIRYSCCY